MKVLKSTGRWKESKKMTVKAENGQEGGVRWDRCKEMALGVLEQNVTRSSRVQ